MALNTQISETMANAMCNTGLAQLNGGGTVRIYGGTQPANADIAVGAQTLLSQHTLSATAFGNAAGGVANANAIADDTARATGTATWCRFFTSGGAAVFDGSVGTANANLILNSTDIQQNAKVSISTYQFSVLKAGQ